jgi:hypothetical protein
MAVVAVVVVVVVVVEDEHLFDMVVVEAQIYPDT